MSATKKVSTKRGMKEAMKPTIENLVCQEIRMLRFEQMGSPSFIVEEMAGTIKEMKRELVHLTESVPQKERGSLIKKMIREAVEEEIERTVQQRGNPCLRCIHLRYYDSELTPHANFPTGTRRVQAIGCDRIQALSRVRCERFIETPGTISPVDYVEEMNLLYDLRDMFKKMKEIWDYFNK